MKLNFIKGSALSLACFFMVCFFTASTATALNGKVLVAVIDTGVDTQHKDLKKSIWINAGESGKDIRGKDKSTNGIDDDGNGFIDDIHGWNFVDNNNKVMDFEGHGTHVAGVINKQFRQKNHSVDLNIMVLKYYNPKASNQVNVENTVKALNYAIQMKAVIINYSAGGAVAEATELQAIKKARQAGIIMVVAAGNEQEDTDQHSYYPASYGLDNMISVAALESDGSLTGFSNYGSHTVDLAAPGKLIYSTLPKNRYGMLSGTSQATAFVSGQLAALIGDRKPASYRAAIENLFKKAVYSPRLKGRTKFEVALLGEIN